MAGEVPEFYCRAGPASADDGSPTSTAARTTRTSSIACPVSINGKVYRCTGVLISVMNHRTGQELFKGERIGSEVEAP